MLRSTFTYTKPYTHKYNHAQMHTQRHTRTLGASHCHGNSNQQRLPFPYYSGDMTVSLSFFLPSLHYDFFFFSFHSLPSSFFLCVFFYISYHPPPFFLISGPFSFTPSDTNHHRKPENNIYSFLVYFLRKGLGQHDRTCLRRAAGRHGEYGENFSSSQMWASRRYLFFLSVLDVLILFCPGFRLDPNLFIPMLNTELLFSMIRLLIHHLYQ